MNIKPLYIKYTLFYCKCEGFRLLRNVFTSGSLIRVRCSGRHSGTRPSPLCSSSIHHPPSIIHPSLHPSSVLSTKPSPTLGRMCSLKGGRLCTFSLTHCPGCLKTLYTGRGEPPYPHLRYPSPRTYLLFLYIVSSFVDYQLETRLSPYPLILCDVCNNFNVYHNNPTFIILPCAGRDRDHVPCRSSCAFQSCFVLMFIAALMLCHFGHVHPPHCVILVLIFIASFFMVYIVFLVAVFLLCARPRFALDLVRALPLPSLPLQRSHDLPRFAYAWTRPGWLARGATISPSARP